MNCPVCERSLAPTLSICPGCGAMMHDSVREELQSKVVPSMMQPVERTATPNSTPTLAPPAAYRPEAMVRPRKRPTTADLAPAKTNPTLVEFQNKNAPLPDWRIHLQNAVQQRRGGKGTDTDTTTYPTNGGAALKAQPVPVEAAINIDKISDPRVANAMRRIDTSRNTFTTPKEAAVEKAAALKLKAASRQYPFDVVSTPKPAPPRAVVPPAPKPKLVVPSTAVEFSTPAPVPELKVDTNKLPKLDTLIERVKPVERTTEQRDPTPAGEFCAINRIRIKAENVDATAEVEMFNDEIEDLAPISMRFGAGLFDLIVGGFLSMLVLAPIALNGGDWFTTSGFLVAAGTWALAMFVYMTVSLGLLGRTLGMRLFSLELVDAVENEYPTLRQAAVSSSIFLLSLVTLGAGFATMFFNEERRAVHDLLSGTILVREF